MADDSTVMTPPVAKPDWFLNILTGKIPDDVNDMHKDGMRMDDFSFKTDDPNAYWNKKTVQAQFTDPDTGNMRRDSFDRYYEDMRKEFLTNKANEFYLDNYQANTLTKLGARLGNVLPQTEVVHGYPDPWGRTYDSTLYGRGLSPASQGWRETAIQRGVKTASGYTPVKDFNGYAKFAVDDKGMKLDSQGYPYLEPVKTGEELKAGEEIYNRMSDWMGYYGHDYNAGMFLSEIPKNAINFLEQTVSSLAEYPKGALALMDQEGSGAYKDITKVQNWAKSFHVPMTERGSAGTFTAEGLADTGLQLLATIASMYAAGASVSKLSASPALGQTAGSLWMTAISAGSMGEIARQNGLSAKESALMMGLLSAAYYPMMSMNWSILKGFGMNASRRTMNEALMKELPELNIKSPTAAGRWAFIQKARIQASKMLYGLQKQSGAVGAGFRAAEAMSIFHGVDLAAKLGYNYLYNANVNPASPAARWLGTTRAGQFHIDWGEEARALGQTAVGGFLGGAASHAVFHAVGIKQPETTKGILEMAADGKADQLMAHVDKLDSQGLLDYKWLNNKQEPVKAGEPSKNSESASVLKSVIKWADELARSQGLDKLYGNNKTKLQALQLYERMRSEDKDVPNVLEASSLGKDATDLLSQIADLTKEVSDAQGKEGSATDQTRVKELNQQIADKQEALDRIKSGDAVADYVLEGIYNFAKLRYGARGGLTGKQFAQLNNRAPDVQKALQDAATESATALAEKDAAATIDNPAGVSSERRQQLFDEASGNLQKVLTTFTPEELSRDITTDEGTETISVTPDGAMGTKNQRAEALANLQQLIGMTDDVKMQARYGELAKAITDVGRVEDIIPQRPAAVPAPERQLMNMTLHTEEGNVMPTARPIADVLAAEQATRNVTSQGNTSFYQATDNLEPLGKSISDRIDQNSAMLTMPSLANDAMERLGAQKLPEVPAEELAGNVRRLSEWMGEVNNLKALSEKNRENPEALARNAAIHHLARQFSYLNDLATRAASNGLTDLADIISTADSGFSKAMDNRDIEGALKIQRLTEDAVYEKYSGNRKAILDLYESEPLDPMQVNIGKDMDKVYAYNYAYAITSMKSTDLWNAWRDAIDSIADKQKLPSHEQFIAARLAVQAIFGGHYDPKFYAQAIQPLHYNNSATIDGRGGTGKTSVVIPVAAGMFNKLTGKSVMLTAYNEGEGQRSASLTEGAADYYRASADKTGIDIKSTERNLNDLLDHPEELENVGLIVYDEATLLTADDLHDINGKLDNLNKGIDNPGDRLHILYTYDSRQNVRDAVRDPSRMAPIPYGIYLTSKDLVPRFPSLEFSFRQRNQQLTLLAGHLEGAQEVEGAGQPFTAEYEKDDGVNIQNDYSAFTRMASSMLERAYKDGRIQGEVVYITDKPKLSLPADILKYNTVRVVNSREAQGLEWDHVIYDPGNTALYGEGLNLVTKKDFYTAVTRARKGLLMYSPSANMLYSRKGKVAAINPVELPESTRESAAATVDAVLGDDRVFSSRQGATYATTRPVNAQLSELEHQNMETFGYVPKDAVPAQQVQLTDAVDKLSSFLNTLAHPGKKDEGVEFKTFHTGEAGMSEARLQRKMDMLYSPLVQSQTRYYLTVTRQLGDYRNFNDVSGNAEKFKGTYGLFLEGYHEPSRELERIGIAAADPEGIEKFVNENNLFHNVKGDEIRLPMGKNFLARAVNLRPVFMGKGDEKMRVVRAKSKGVHFGDLFVDVRGTSHGQAFIPVSSRYKPEDITNAYVNDRVKPNTDEDAATKRLYLQESYLSPDEMEEVLRRAAHSHNLEDAYVQIEDGSYRLNYDVLGPVYNALWKTNTHSGFRFDQFGFMTPKENRVQEAFRDIVRDLGEPKSEQEQHYYDFLRNYADHESESQYFLERYLENKKNNPGKGQFYRSAFQALLEHKNFKRGFQFSPYIDKNSTKAYTWAKAQEIPQSIVDDYFTTMSSATGGQPDKHGASFVSMPTPTFLKADLLTALSEGKGQPQLERISSSGLREVVRENPHGPDPAGDLFDNDAETENSAANLRTQQDETELAKPPKLTMEQVQKTFFPKPAHLQLMEDMIAGFRRRVFDAMFHLKADNADDVQLNNITDMVHKLKAGYQAALENVDPSLVDNPDAAVANYEKFGRMYSDAVAAKAFDTLMKEYFSTVTANPDGTYALHSTHIRNQAFYDKDSLSHLYDGMTEMTRGMLESTPILKAVRGGLTATDNFLTRNDVEEISRAIMGVRTLDEAQRAMETSGSPVVQAIYRRFFISTPSTIDGQQTFSVAHIKEYDGRQILTALQHYLQTGMPMDFMRTVINGKNERVILPSNPYGRINSMMEVSMKAINDTKEKFSKSLPSKITTGSVVLNEHPITSPKADNVSDNSVVESVRALGLLNFGSRELAWLKENKRQELGVTPTADDNFVNKAILSRFVIPTLGWMKSGKGDFSPHAKQLVDAIIGANRYNDVLQYQDIAGNRVDRLRRTSAFFELPVEISRQKQMTGNSLYAGSPLFTDWQVDGVLPREGIRNETSLLTRVKKEMAMSEDENYEQDILWGFAKVLANNYESRGKYDTFTIPVKSFADSTTVPVLSIRTPSSAFRSPRTIAEKLFAYKASYYDAMLKNWEAGKDETGNAVKLPGDILERIREERNFYNNKENFARFFGQRQKYADELIASTKNIVYEKNEVRNIFDTLHDKIGRTIPGKTADQIVNAFYWNWLAVSEAANDISGQPSFMYKGKTDTARYIDEVKRNKQEITPATAFVLRNDGWHDIYKSRSGMLTELERLEGKKLPRNVRVAYMKDPKQALLSLSAGLSGRMKDYFKVQDIYDGATFTNFLTRIMQNYSNGGDHGTPSRPVMKYVTYAKDHVLGIKKLIKNGDYEITPELLRIGTDGYRKMFVSMMSPKFKGSYASSTGKEMVNALDVLHNEPLTFRGQQLPVVKQDFSNITREHGEALLDWLVDRGLQDIPITEVIPVSAAKTWKGSLNDMEGDYPEGYRWEMMNQEHKGQVMDATHDTEQATSVKMNSQAVSVAPIDFMNPAQVNIMFDSLAAIADEQSTKLNALNSKELKDELTRMMAGKIQGMNDFSYITNAIRSQDFSFDDRQIVRYFVKSLNAEMTARGIMFSFGGLSGHYILNPGVIDVYEATRNVDGKDTKVLLRRDMLSEQERNLKPRQLAWSDPIENATGKKLSEKIREIYTSAFGSRMKGKTDEDIARLLANVKPADPEYTTIHEKLNALQHSMRTAGAWTKGEAEIAIPLSGPVRDQFGIDVNRPVAEFTSSYFEKVLTTPDEKGVMRMPRKSVRDSEGNDIAETDESYRRRVAVRAQQMHDDFHDMLPMITFRIPTSGPQAIVNTKVAFFVNESDNALFASPYMLLVQGADLDGDTGHTTGLESIDGRIPRLDANGKLIDYQLYGSRKDEARLAALKNQVAAAQREISGDPRNLAQSNITMESILDQMRKLRDERIGRSKTYSREDYGSMAQMKYLNQSSAALRGILANAEKAYLTMYGISKLSGRPIPGLAEADADFNTIWQRFTAWVNAATDNPKEQILGVLGANEYNANIISYLLATGHDNQYIARFLDAHAKDFKLMEQAGHHTSRRSFDPAGWKDPAMEALYYKGREYATLAMGLMNRMLPKGPEDVFMYRNGIERFINQSFEKEFGDAAPDFDMMRFIDDKAYADRMAGKYDELINASPNHEFNILRVFRDSPHVAAYLRLFSTVSKAIDKVSKIIGVTDGMASTLSREGENVNAAVYNDIMDYNYGLAVHNYMATYKKEIAGFPLYTPEGRSRFVDYVNAGGIEILKRVHPDNPFIQSLTLPERITRPRWAERNAWGDSKQLRGPDYSNMDASQLMIHRAAFDAFRKEDPGSAAVLLHYSLITSKGKAGKGSIIQLYDPQDLKGFNAYVKYLLDSKGFDPPVEGYTAFARNTADSKLKFNAIPYTMEPMEVKGTPVLQKAEEKITFNTVGTGYKPRTKLNAQASDATLQIAIDFNTPGEQYTSRVAGHKSIKVNANDAEISAQRVKGIVDSLNKRNTKILNIAGNDISSLAGKMTQAQADTFTYNLLKAITEHPDLKNKIGHIGTGGQTGFDESGAKAGARLGIPVIVTAPEGWEFRNAKGQDIYSESSFKARFADISAPMQQRIAVAESKAVSLSDGDRLTLQMRFGIELPEKATLDSQVPDAPFDLTIREHLESLMQQSTEANRLGGKMADLKPKDMRIMKDMLSRYTRNKTAEEGKINMTKCGI